MGPTTNSRLLEPLDVGILVLQTESEGMVVKDSYQLSIVMDMILLLR